MTSIWFDDDADDRWDDTDTIVVACDDLVRRTRLTAAIRALGMAAIQDRAGLHAARHIPVRGTARRNDEPVAAAIVVLGRDGERAWQLVERLRAADWAMPIVVVAAEPSSDEVSEWADLLSIDCVLDASLDDAQIAFIAEGLSQGVEPDTFIRRRARA